MLRPNVNVLPVLIVSVAVVVFFLLLAQAIATSSGVCEPKGGDVIQLSGRFGFFPMYDAAAPRTKMLGVNWTVHIRWMEGQNISGYCLATTDADGTWSKTLARPTNADSLEIAVFSMNDYVAVTVLAGVAHEVAVLKGVPIPADQKLVHLGDLTADLSQDVPNSKKHLVGVGDVMAASARFRNQANDHSLDVKSQDSAGFDKPVRIYFPNTWYDCATGTGDPSTCSSSDERAEIWITREDMIHPGLERYGRYILVMHELAHQLNADKWEFTLPADDKKPVPINCAVRPTALMEGFSTALAAWAYYGELEKMPKSVWLDDGGIPHVTNLEMPSPQDCNSGKHSHTDVSALFWDLLDRQDDAPTSSHAGQDKWSFNDPMTPFKIYLNPPRKKDGFLDVWSDIEVLRGVFKRGLSDADKQHIDQIYLNNRMEIP